jgi:hypothetical protein
MQTPEGSLKATETIRKRYGADFYQRVGKMGGAKSRTGGFGSKKVGADGLTGQERAKKAGRLGGHTSKRGKSKPKDETQTPDTETTK